MKKRHTIVIVCGMVAFTSLHSQTPDSAFAITVSDQNWLTYYDITNAFDSATVMFSYGEMLVRTSSSKIRVKPATTRRPNDWMTNSGSNGVQTDIVSQAAWEPVTIPVGSELRFYRAAQVSSYCPDQEQHQHQGGQPISWSITDKVTECILELRDVVNDTVVFVADSVGIDATTSSSFSGFYGTSPSVFYRSVTLPATSYGKTVRIVVKPRRIGASPFGMAFVPSRWDIARSVLEPSATSGFVNRTSYEHLDSIRFAQYLQFVQASWDAYCYIPPYHSLRFSEQQVDTIHARFFSDTVINGRTIWQMRPCIGDSYGMIAKGGTQSTANGTVVYTSSLEIESTSGTEGRVLMDVRLTGEPRFVSVSAFLPTGQEIGWPECRRLEVGRSQVGVNIPSSYHGVVLLRVADAHGRGIGFAKVIVP